MLRSLIPHPSPNQLDTFNRRSFGSFSTNIFVRFSISHIYTRNNKSPLKHHSASDSFVSFLRFFHLTVHFAVSDISVKQMAEIKKCPDADFKGP